jgi:hypothetical protein
MLGSLIILDLLQNPTTTKKSISGIRRNPDKRVLNKMRNPGKRVLCKLNQ